VGEYTSTEFKEYLTSGDIEHQLSIPGRPGVAEHLNRTLIKHARNMRLHADMSEGFWTGKVSHASYLVNKSPSAIVNLQIQEEI